MSWTACRCWNASPGTPISACSSRARKSSDLKRASEELIERLATLDGVRNLHDDLPYGNDQLVFELTPEGQALGLSTAEVGSQLRAAYDGRRVQIFQDADAEMEVRLTLPEVERADPASLARFPIRTSRRRDDAAVPASPPGSAGAASTRFATTTRARNGFRERRCGSRHDHRRRGGGVRDRGSDPGTRAQVRHQLWPRRREPRGAGGADAVPAQLHDHARPHLHCPRVGVFLLHVAACRYGSDSAGPHRGARRARADGAAHQSRCR